MLKLRSEKSETEYHTTQGKRKRKVVRKLIYALVITLTALSTVSCAKGYDIRPAPIHELGISLSQSFPVEVFLYIKGGLADSATELNEIKVLGLTDNTLNITVTTKRLRDAAASQVYGYFEKTLNLGSDFISGQIYTVKVNDMTKQFIKP